MHQCKGARRRRGQGMTEYIVIVGLIAILAIGAIEKFSQGLKGAFAKSGDAISRRVSGPIGKMKSSGAAAPSGANPSPAVVGGDKDPKDDKDDKDKPGVPPKKPGN